MIADYDVFCQRKNLLEMLYQRLYEVLFQGNCDSLRRKVIRLNLITTFDEYS